jgi:hypothetical protein
VQRFAEEFLETRYRLNSHRVTPIERPHRTYRHCASNN